MNKLFSYKGYGGDSHTFHKALRGVEIIYCTNWAFAAVLKDGTVMTWGQKSYSGECHTVQ